MYSKPESIAALVERSRPMLSMLPGYKPPPPPTRRQRFAAWCARVADRFRRAAQHVWRGYCDGEDC